MSGHLEASSGSPSPSRDNTGRRYEIKHISDIFNIPEDRFDDFLVDFKSFYQLGKPMAELIETIANEAAKLQVKPAIEKMAWIDDGKHNAKIYIKPQDGPDKPNRRTK